MRSVALTALVFVILNQGKRNNINSKKVEKKSGHLTGPCCDLKTVGDVQDPLVSMGEVPSSCLASCIYQRNDQIDSRLDFSKGVLPVTYIGKRKVKRKY